MPATSVPQALVADLCTALGYDPRDVRSIDIEPKRITVTSFRRDDAGRLRSQRPPPTSATARCWTASPSRSASRRPHPRRTTMPDKTWMARVMPPLGGAASTDQQRLDAIRRNGRRWATGSDWMWMLDRAQEAIAARAEVESLRKDAAQASERFQAAIEQRDSALAEVEQLHSRIAETAPEEES